jgi:hypothetical protein
MKQDETLARIKTTPADRMNVLPAKAEALPKRLKVKTAVHAGDAFVGGGGGNGTTYP